VVYERLRAGQIEYKPGELALLAPYIQMVKGVKPPDALQDNS